MGNGAQQGDHPKKVLAHVGTTLAVAEKLYGTLLYPNTIIPGICLEVGYKGVTVSSSAHSGLWGMRAKPFSRGHR